MVERERNKKYELEQKIKEVKRSLHDEFDEKIKK